MRPKILIIGALVLLFGVAVGYDMMAPPKQMTVVEKSEERLDPAMWKSVPEVELTTIHGEKLSFKDLQGKVVLLNFWATWCPTCIKDFPSMKKAIQEYNGDVVVVALSNDEDKETIADFLKLYEQKYDEKLEDRFLYICWDKNRQITSNVFNTARFPETIIISKNSKMARKLIGEVEWNSPQVKALLGKLLTLD